MQSGPPPPALEISHPLVGCSLPRQRSSWRLDFKSFATWQDLIKICFYTSGWLSPPLRHQPRPQCWWENSLCMAMPGPGLWLPFLPWPRAKTSPKMLDDLWGGSSLAARLAALVRLPSELWTDKRCWQHSIRNCCLTKTEISCGNTLCQF